MYLYKTDASKVNGLEVGNHVNVLGKVDIYNGGFQIASADVKKVETSSAVTPTTLELKDNLTGVDGKDTGRKVSVTGTLKGAPQLDEYENVTLTIALTDKSEVNLKADSRYVPGYQLEALKALKADSTVTVNGFVTFNVSQSTTLPTDAKGLQIVALSVPGVESDRISLTNASLNNGEPYTDSSNKYNSFENLTVGSITFKGDLGVAGYGSNNDPIIAMRTKLSGSEITNQSYFTNTTALNGYKEFLVNYNADSIAKHSPVLPKVFFSDKVITTTEGLTAATFDKEPSTTNTQYKVEIPADAQYIYVVHPGTSENKLFTYYFDSFVFVE